MRIQIISDLHLEKINNNEINGLDYINPTGDILILAGDIGSLYKINQLTFFFNSITSHFKYIIYVPGNNEYYTINGIPKLKLHELNGILYNLCSKFQNISILNNDSIIINNYLFIGSILFSNIDYKLPKFFRIYGMDSNLYNRKNENNIKYIKKMINIYETQYKQHIPKIIPIIITHYPPSKQCYNGNSYYDTMYYNHLDELFNKNLIWIYGHSDLNMNKYILNTMIISNQRGKETNVNINFSDDKIINV